MRADGRMRVLPLDMNRPLSLPSPPLWAGERVAEGRERGSRNGSWSQCTGAGPRGLSMNHVAQPSRLRVAAASRRQYEHRARRPVNSQARTPALHPPGSSWSQCTASKSWRLSMNLSVLPASCRQSHRITALPTRLRQHLVGGAVRLVRGSWRGDAGCQESNPANRSVQLWNAPRQ